MRRIRIATKDDIQAILSLCVKKRITTMKESDSYKRYIRSNLKNFIVVCNAMDEVTGFMKVRPYNSKKVKIEHLCVDNNSITIAKELVAGLKSRYNIIEYRGKNSKSLGFKNGVINVTSVNLKYIINDKLKTRYETLDGIKYLVAPVVLVREQVLNGEFLPADEIEKSALGWNGRPVVVYHPEEKDGSPASANRPDMVKSYEVGRLFNIEYEPESTKLKGEIWIDISKASRKNPDTKKAIDMIQHSDELQVSTGYFVTKFVDVSGEYDGVEYNGIQQNILPDHLALLPEEEGACNWEDGAGVRNNRLFTAMKNIFKTNMQSSIHDLLVDELQKVGEDAKKVEDIYYEDGNSYVVYKTKNKRNKDVMRRCEFEYDKETDTIIIGDIFDEVEPVLQYKTKTTRNNRRNNVMNKKKLVLQIMANSGGKLKGKETQAMLMKLDINTLKGLLAKNKTKKVTKKKAEPKANKRVARRINKIMSKEIALNEADEEELLLVSELVDMDESEIIDFVEGLSEGDVEEVLTILDDVIDELEVVEELVDDTSEIEAAIEEIEDVIAIVEDAEGLESDGSEDDDMADNELDAEELEEPGEEDEDELVDELESVSNRRNRRNRKMTMNDYIKNIPDRDAREFISNGMTNAKTYKNNLIKKITRNKSAGWTKDELTIMSMKQLEKIAKSLSINVDYSVNSISGFESKGKKKNDGEGVPLSVNIFRPEEKKKGDK